jgi:hypothetical protein
MTYTLYQFEQLCKTYTTWAELKEFLVSADGGRLRIVESDDSPGFAICRYVKGESDFQKGAGLFRSVVWDTNACRPVCFAPAKAALGPPPLATPLASIEEFVDGCMMQAFVSKADPTKLQIATRTQLGGQNTFYGKKSFRDMFEECLAGTPIRTVEALLEVMHDALGDQDAVFASFVLQHPDHRVVAKIVSPDMHMIHLGSVAADGTVAVSEQSSTWPVALRRLQVARYPVREFADEAEIYDLMRRTAVQNGFRWQGLVFKDGAGKRWRLRSTSYTMLRGLRGSEATTLERFLRLRKEGKVVEYLKHYGQEQSGGVDERAEFWSLEQQLRKCTTAVYEAYNAVHKAHTLKFAQLPAAFQPAVHLMHVEYLTTLRPKKANVQLSVAIQIVNGLKTFEQKRLLGSSQQVRPAEADADAVAALLSLGTTG